MATPCTDALRAAAPLSFGSAAVRGPERRQPGALKAAGWDRRPADDDVAPSALTEHRTRAPEGCRIEIRMAVIWRPRSLFRCANRLALRRAGRFPRSMASPWRVFTSSGIRPRNTEPRATRKGAGCSTRRHSSTDTNSPGASSPEDWPDDPTNRRPRGARRLHRHQPPAARLARRAAARVRREEVPPPQALLRCRAALPRPSPRAHRRTLRGGAAAHRLGRWVEVMGVEVMAGEVMAVEVKRGTRRKCLPVRQRAFSDPTVAVLRRRVRRIRFLSADPRERELERQQEEQHPPTRRSRRPRHRCHRGLPASAARSAPAHPNPGCRLRGRPG